MERFDHPAGEIELAERGVYWARYLKGGKPIAYAVDSKGDVVRRYVVQADERAELAIAMLWDFLDVVDPRPQLRLVKLQLPSVDRRAVVEVFDPYNAPPLPGTWRHHR